MDTKGSAGPRGPCRQIDLEKRDWISRASRENFATEYISKVFEFCAAKLFCGGRLLKSFWRFLIREPPHQCGAGRPRGPGKPGARSVSGAPDHHVAQWRIWQ